MKTMKNLKLLGIASTIFLAAIITFSAFDRAKSTSLVPHDWPETSKKAAESMKAKYGEPSESTPSMMVWNKKGPWKRIIVYKEEVSHDFPMPHKDVLEGFIDYKVPSDKFDDLAMYDGSIICERTKGELSARCDKEDMNFLAINLANDIVNGTRNINEARDFYAQSVVAYMKKDKQPYTQAFQFKVEKGGTADDDEMSDNIELKDLMRMMKEKVKEKVGN